MGKIKISRLFLCLLLSIPLLLFSKCDFLEPEEESTATTVIINLNVPAGMDVSGKSWDIVFTTNIVEMEFSNFDYYTSGTCVSGTTQNIVLNDVDAGTYYLFAVIYMSQRTEEGPQPGDCVGIYGSLDPEEMTAPNATVPESGEVTFNITMFEMEGDVGPVLAGNLIIPEPAPGKEWCVILDEDGDRGNGIVAEEYGICGESINVPYEIQEAPPGIYKFFAIVNVVSEPGSFQVNGDYFKHLEEVTINETGTQYLDVNMTIVDWLTIHK